MFTTNFSQKLSMNHHGQFMNLMNQHSSTIKYTYSLPMIVALQAAPAELWVPVGDCSGLGDGPVRADGGVRGARQVRQLRPRRTPPHTLLPRVSKIEYKHYRVL